MQKQLAVEQLAIADWVKNLAAISERDFTLENIQDYIVQHTVRPRLSKNISSSPMEITRAT